MILQVSAFIRADTYYATLGEKNTIKTNYEIPSYITNSIILWDKIRFLF